MLASRPGYVIAQGQRLFEHFRDAGYISMGVSPHPSGALRLLDTVLTLLRRGGGIDILVADIYGGRSFVIEDAATWIGRRQGHRIVMVLHGGALPAFAGKFPRWFRRVLRRADAIVTPSSYLARELGMLGVACRIIPNVIDLEQYPHRKRESVGPRLFWMRSFHAVYNPMMAVRVLARLRRVIPGATLVMAGQDKGMQAAVKRRAEELGLREAIRFPGFLDAEGKRREGEAAEIFINTSRVDNMPVAVVEAWALGLPVVSTAVGGVPDLLERGEAGLLVPDDDDAAMAKAILKVIDTPALAARLSRDGRRLAERSAWDLVRHQWEDLFASAEAPDRGIRGNG
jgi:L-malate glycosyltransferase